MKPTLLTHRVWSRLTALARRKSAAFVAVPYFAKGASDLLPLRSGSQLVVRFDRESVSSGQVDPREIIRLLKRGVEVHACSNLHAKVFVFGNTAVVGSANVSSSSANALVEACVEVTNGNFATSCRRFVESLRGDPIELEFARKMVKLYKPPHAGRTRRANGAKPKPVIPKHSDIWNVALVQGSWRDVDNEQEKAGWAKAEQAISNPKRSEIETFLCYGGRILEELKRGERVLMNTKIDQRRVLVSPPGKVLDIRRYRVGKRSRCIVYLELPRNTRRRKLSAFLKSLGPAAKGLGNPRRTKRIRDSELVYTLGRLFS